MRSITTLLLLLGPWILHSQITIELPQPSWEATATISVEKTVDQLYFFSGYRAVRNAFASLSEVTTDSAAAHNLEKVLDSPGSACLPVKLPLSALGEQDLLPTEPNWYFICGFISANDHILISRIAKREEAGGQVNEWVCNFSVHDSSWAPSGAGLPHHEVLASLLSVLTPMAWEALYSPTPGLGEPFHQETLLANELVHTPFPGRRIDLMRLSALLTQTPSLQLVPQVKGYHTDGIRLVHSVQPNEQK